MGLWYASSEQALIGGTFSAVEGHNPWEALQLGCGVMHGPRVENFVTDFDILRQAKACFAVHNAEDIVAHVTSPPARGLESFERLQHANRSKISNLTDQLLKLIRA
jgi:3-deoxy-D-manno-octulosonic-acid transferase